MPHELSALTMKSLSLSSGAERLSLPRWLPLLLIVGIAIAIRSVVLTNLDESWGLTMAEKVLDGQRLYVDIFEINPPATMFLYIVPALLGRLSGLPAEIFVDTLVFLASGLSLWLASRILQRAGTADDDDWTLISVTTAALLILPAHAFGEREHIALIAFIPILAVAAVRAQGKTPDWSMAIVAGIGGGITAIIKPHFAVPIICAATVAAVQVRSWRPIFALENWIAAFMLAAYAILVVVAYPQFISDILPIVLAVYVPLRLPLPTLLVDVAVPLWVASVVLIALLKWRTLLAPAYSVLLAASTGFLLAFLAQGKGWAYQSYPMLALILIALAIAVIEQWRRKHDYAAAGRSARLTSGLATSLIVGLTVSWMNVTVDPTAAAATVRTIKPHPKIMAFSSFLWTGFPLTRMVEGIWVGRFQFLWITGGVQYLRQHEPLDPAIARRLDAYVAREKAMVTEDIARQRPDVILVDRLDRRIDWMAWANSYPPLAAEMRHYSPYRLVDGIEILRRGADD